MDEPSTERVASALSASAPTMRKRHERKAGEPNRTAATATATALPPPSQQRTKRGSGNVSFLKKVVLCAALIAGSSLVLLLVFLGIQVVVVDEMDLRSTAARMELAGRGEEWLPVWLGNFFIDSLTAMHADAGRHTTGGLKTTWTAMAPDRNIAGPAPPPPLHLSAETSAHEPGEKERAQATASPSAAHPSTGETAELRCYTLEAYSETFLRPPGEETKRGHQLFSCGTRVRDLRTEDRPDVLAACKAHTITAEGVTGNGAPQSRFATLRVVLTAAEEKRHRTIQPVNTVTQRIPLVRVNDDYCDCLDGTDELLTNACSMSGPLSPAAGSRWKSYLISNQAIELYDEPDLLEQEDRESRGTPLVPRKRGDVGDRLYVSQGPVLPFLCMCAGTVRQLLAPSLVGDGVVDCCAAEDEAMLQGSPYVSLSFFTNNALDAQDEYDLFLDSEHDRVLQQWKERQAAVAVQLNPSVSYADLLFPYHTSARALLVDRGYYSLFPADVVAQERRAAATVLHDLYSRGHRMQRRRVQKGWERLGRHLAENRTALQVELANMTREIEDIERFVQARLEERRTHNPIEAGVPMELLQRHKQLSFAYQAMRLEIEHLAVTSLHHAYGNHYEYYPLVRRALAIAQKQVTDSNTPSDLYSAIAAARARRRVTPSMLEQLAVAAQQQGKEIPLYMDNLSVSYYGIEVMRHTIVAQRFSASEAPHVAEMLGLRPRNSTAPFDPHVFDKITDPFLRAPILPLASWQPFQSERDGRSMQLADPAGDVHLARRACVAPASPLYRGGGRLQFPTRHPEAPRSVTITDAEEEKRSLKEKQQAMTQGTVPGGKKVSIPYHFHTPSIFAVDRYMGSVRCDADRLSASASHHHSPADDDDDHKSEGDSEDARQTMAADRTVQMYTTFLCDTADRLLYWGRNGRCNHEVIVGTPSACPAWALKVAKSALKELTSQKEQGEKSVHDGDDATGE